MNKLKGIMRERNVTQQELAVILGISLQSLNAKINERTAFTVPEAKRICKFLDLENPAEIFFDDNVPKTQQRNKDIDEVSEHEI